MSPRWERSPDAPEFDGALYMDATLRPNRSLSRQAFKLMLLAVIVANAGVAAVFLAHGAFPVAGFLGLDVLALWLAFHMNYRSGKRRELVRIGPNRVHVAAIDPDGVATHWVLNPVWARVLREGTGVLIRAGAGQMRVGAFLSPKECDAFAQALNTAIFKAKRG
ncbi:DUF2244 domain-containing protein [Terricaulis sp.]|uniref:DUF2244 domain-containing protein n=1 Tax=Terricaulis sp. TaxID=2768686 RepID=UPI0037850C0C